MENNKPNLGNASELTEPSKSPEKPKEYVDLYDENNQPLNEKAPRDQAHAEGLWHRTVHIYVVRETERGTELLVHRRAKQKKQYAGTLDPVFGGHLKSGQDENQTALDELREETGIIPDPTRLKYAGFAKKDDPINAPNDREFNIIFTYHITPTEEGQLQFDPEEVDSTEWHALSGVLSDVENNTSDWRTSPKEITDGLNVLLPALEKKD